MNDYEFDFSEAGYWLEPDFVLSDIVTTLVNVMGMPVGITLFLKGMVISGVLVSEGEYLSSLSEVFNQIAKDSFKAVGDPLDSVESLFDFTTLSESYSPQPPESAEDEDEAFEVPSAPIRHLHIRDVTILSPQPGIAFSRSLMPIMRIRLTAIDGWMLGQAVGIDDYGDDDDVTSNGNGKNLLH